MQFSNLFLFNIVTLDLRESSDPGGQLRDNGAALVNLFGLACSLIHEGGP
jgi:hypothetical protein